MRAWCALAVVIGTIAGCDSVFGLEGRVDDDDSIEITDLQILGTTPTIDESRDVRATVHGPPRSSQLYAVTASAGTLDPPGGIVKLDDNGDATIASVYRPTTSGTITLSAMVASTSTMVMFEVLDLEIVGRDTGTGSIDIGANQYFGAKVNLASPGELRTLGLFSIMPAGTRGKFAVYADSGGVPANRIVDLSTAQPIAEGRNKFATPVTMLPAGDYWIVGMFDMNLRVANEFANAATYGLVGGLFADPMPASLPGFGTTPSAQVAFFLLVVPQ